MLPRAAQFGRFRPTLPAIAPSCPIFYWGSVLGQVVRLDFGARLGTRMKMIRPSPSLMLPTQLLRSARPQPAVLLRPGNKRTASHMTPPAKRVGFDQVLFDPECDECTSHMFSKRAYHHGIVTIQCPKCKNRYALIVQTHNYFFVFYCQPLPTHEDDNPVVGCPRLSFTRSLVFSICSPSPTPTVVA